MAVENISYGIGKDYLKNWGIHEALREIYQNFIDYGKFNTFVSPVSKEGDVIVTLFNKYNPDNFEFLRIGFSDKPSNSVGKYGEGIKMALFVLARENYNCSIITNKHIIKPIFLSSSIGEIFNLQIKESNINSSENKSFKVNFKIPLKEYEAFKEKLVFKKDVIFDLPDYGQIINKPAGEIYVGKLFVTKVDNLKQSYNFNPTFVSLNRDRNMVNSFDINYNASIINTAYQKMNVKDLEYDDFKYVRKIPNDLKQNIKPRLNTANEIEFVYSSKDEITQKEIEKVIKHDNLTESLKKDNFFEKIINSLKKKILNFLGYKDALTSFKDKYAKYLPQEGVEHLDYIIENYNKN